MMPATEPTVSALRRAHSFPEKSKHYRCWSRNEIITQMLYPSLPSLSAFVDSLHLGAVMYSVEHSSVNVDVRPPAAAARFR